MDSLSLLLLMRPVWQMELSTGMMAIQLVNTRKYILTNIVIKISFLIPHFLRTIIKYLLTLILRINK